MNSGFYPVVLMPGCCRVQTQSQQIPIYLGGSNVPYDLANNDIYYHCSGPTHLFSQGKGSVDEYEDSEDEKPSRPNKKPHKKSAKKKTKK
jgi:hypothetical protein